MKHLLADEAERLELASRVRDQVLVKLHPRAALRDALAMVARAAGGAQQEC